MGTPLETKSLKQKKTKIEILILIVPGFLGLTFWFFDGVLDWFFYPGNAFLDVLFWNISAHELCLRFIALTLSFLGGFLVQRLYKHLKLAEHTLVKNESKYRRLFENFTEGYALHELILDASGEPVDYTYLAANTAFCKMTGLKYGTVEGKTVKALFPGIEKDSANWIQRYGEVALRGKILRSEEYSEHLGKWFLIQAFSPEHGQFAVTFTDITEQKQIHETIINLARFPEQNPSPVLRIDRNGRILYANPSSSLLQESWGCQAKGLLPESPRQWVVDTLVSDKSQLHEVTCGNIVYALMFTPVAEADFVNIYGHDVTERKAAEMQVIEQQRQLSALISNVPGMCYRCLNDRDRTMEFISNGVLELTGHAPDEFLTRQVSYDDLIHNQDQDMVWDAIQEAILLKKPFEMTYRLRTEAGQEKWIWERGLPVFDDMGHFQALEGLMADITGQKLAEFQVQESLERERFLADIIRNAPMAIGIGFPDGRMDACNTAFTQLTGYTEKELKAIDWNTTLTPEKWRAKEAQWLSQLHQSHNTVHYEKEYLRKDGTLVPIELVVTASFDTNKQPKYYIGFVNDITERKKNEMQTRLMQEQLIEQQRHEKEHVQEELDKVKDELVRKTQLAAIGQVSASIAHDLRNPLACVRNANYLLKRRLSQEDTKHTRQLHIIDQEVEKADKIITNLLSIARCRPPKKEAVNLDNLIETILKQLAPPPSIRFEYECRDRPFIIHADPNQMGQVLTNLATNALQAMEGRGRITVKAVRDAHGDRIFVLDSGQGIPPEMLNRIFEPLITTKSSGTGLGLTICQQIVESHGGTIVAENALDHGTIIQIQLPTAT